MGYQREGNLDGREGRHNWDGMRKRMETRSEEHWQASLGYGTRSGRGHHDAWRPVG